MKSIRIRGASENNLIDIDVDIPHHQLICITGVSGSGKSSLAYDVLCREGQRRYLESFSSHARQYLGKLGSPKVESICGLMPAIAVDQRTVSRNPRSTVGTASELHDLLRLLYARFGKANDAKLPLRRSLFSFNHPDGMCPTCKGLGLEERIDPLLLIEDPCRSLRQGALKITTKDGYTVYSQVTMPTKRGSLRR